MLSRSDPPPAAMTHDRPSPALLILSFATIYLVWGSSFVATKVMVHDLPPLLAAGVRFSVAGLLLGGIALARGMRVPRRLCEWRQCAVMGTLLVVTASGLNVVAMRHVASNQAAILNASSAFWITLLGTQGAHGSPLTLRSGAATLIGFAGVALLLWPAGGFVPGNFGWQLVIVCACLGWALGTLYYRRVRPQLPALMFSALQMLIGGLMLAIAGLARGDAARWVFTASSLAALSFLMLFSSCFAYTAFLYLLRHTTPARFSTYAYVNPAVAAVLGWAVLGERLSAVQLLGTAVILLGVVLVSLPDGRGRPDATATTTPAEPSG
jgi:drug/metabolite transporter (DMT)-like permease